MPLPNFNDVKDEKDVKEIATDFGVSPNTLPGENAKNGVTRLSQTFQKMYLQRLRQSHSDMCCQQWLIF